MGTYEDLKDAIQQVIRPNDNNEITGALLQQTLLSIINSVGANASFAGIATPDTNPGTPDQNVFYLATEAGTYVNFGGIEIAEGEAVVLSNKTGNWVKTSSGFATQQQFTELCLQVDDLKADLYGGDKSEILANGVVNSDKYMRAIDGLVLPSSLGAAVIVFPCVAGDKYKISIPKSNNIAGFYLAYSNVSTLVASSTYIVGVQGCIGTSAAVEYTLNSAEDYPYIAIGYTYADGVPVVEHIRNQARQFALLTDIEGLAEVRDVVDGSFNTKTIKNLYDGSVVDGYVGSDGTLSGASPYLSSGLIPVKGGKFYYINRPFIAGKSAFNLRVLESDKTTAMHAEIASTGQDSGYYRQRDEAGNNNVMASQIKIPSSGAYIQFTMWFSSTAPTEAELATIKQVMIEEVGDAYDPTFIPHSYLAPGVDIMIPSLKESVKNDKEFKILLLGNSFLDACVNYVPFILYNIAPDIDVTIVELVKGGSSLSHWRDILDGTDTTSNIDAYVFKKGMTAWKTMVLSGANVQDKVSYAIQMMDYDAIVFQQVSTSVTDYTTYQPYLNDIVEAIYGMVEHPVKLGWLLTPTRNNTLADSVTAFNGAVEAVERIMDETAIDFVIPCGTALQNARTTVLQSLGEDGNLIMSYHPQAGLPCQILAYAFILKVFDLMGMHQTSVYGEDTKVDADWQLNKGLHDLQGLSPNNPVVVTEEYARIAQICAMIANKKPLAITDCAEL